MSEKLKSGDLLFLTSAFNDYFHKRHKDSKLILTNRLAKLEEIIDWDSKKGKLIKAARIKSGKWKKLSIEDNKYLISIFYHDLVGREGQKGVCERGVCMFQCDPETKAPLFCKVPEWMFREIMKKGEEFGLVLERKKSDE